MKILLVEDEERIRGFVEKGLRAEGFTVDTAEDGDTAFTLADGQSYDALVLDIMLPGQDGLAVLKSLRGRSNNVPVLLLTARRELDQRLEGLNLGADDYLTKPFHIDELVARLRAICRRTTGSQLNLLSVGKLKMNLATRDVHYGEDRIELTQREFSLLELLLRSPGRVYTRVQILEHVWEYDFDPQTNLVDVYIKRLREKLGGGGQASLIETIRGVGYRLRDDSRG
jgi:DNA-binding response OmpR family regulator